MIHAYVLTPYRFCHKVSFYCHMYMYILLLYIRKEKQMKCNEMRCVTMLRSRHPGYMTLPARPQKNWPKPPSHPMQQTCQSKHRNLIPVVITSNAPLRKSESLLNLMSNTLPPRHSRHAERGILLCRISVRKLECTVFIFPLGLKTTRADSVANCAPKLTIIPVANLHFKSIPEGGRADLFACDLSVSKMIIGVGEWVVVVVCAVDICFFSPAS